MNNMYKFRLFSVSTKSELPEDTENLSEGNAAESEQIGHVIKVAGKLIYKASKSKKCYKKPPSKKSSHNMGRKQDQGKQLTDLSSAQRREKELIEDNTLDANSIVDDPNTNYDAISIANALKAARNAKKQSKNMSQKDFSIKDHFDSLKSRARSAKDTYNYYKDLSNLAPEYESNMNFVNNSKHALESGNLDDVLRSANLDDKAREEELKKLRRVSSKLQKDSDFMMRHPKWTAMKRAVNEFKNN